MNKAGGLSKKRLRLKSAKRNPADPIPYTPDDFDGIAYADIDTPSLKSALLWEYGREMPSIRRLVETIRRSHKDETATSVRGYNMRPHKYNEIFPFNLDALVTEPDWPRAPYHQSAARRKKPFPLYVDLKDYVQLNVIDSKSGLPQMRKIASPSPFITKRNKKYSICFPMRVASIVVPSLSAESITAEHLVSSYLLFAWRDSWDFKCHPHLIDDYVDRNLDDIDCLGQAEPLSINEGEAVVTIASLCSETGLLSTDLFESASANIDGVSYKGEYNIAFLPLHAAKRMAGIGILGATFLMRRHKGLSVFDEKQDLQHALKSLFALRYSRTDYVPFEDEWDSLQGPFSPFFKTGLQVTQQSDKAISWAQKLYPANPQLAAEQHPVLLKGARSKMELKLRIRGPV